MNRVIIIDGGHRATHVQALLLLLEKSGLAAEALTLSEAEAQGLVRRDTPLRIQTECMPALNYSGEPKLKGTGRSELAQLRKKALHIKPPRRI